MFRLGILFEIKIQNYLRSNQVIKSHQGSNFGQSCQKESNRAVWSNYKTVDTCFDSEFGRELKFKIILDQIRIKSPQRTFI